MVEAVGFEPTCCYEWIYSPSPSASRSHFLILVEDRRIELLTEACKATAFPITPIPRKNTTWTLCYKAD